MYYSRVTEPSYCEQMREHLANESQRAVGKLGEKDLLNFKLAHDRSVICFAILLSAQHEDSRTIRDGVLFECKPFIFCDENIASLSRTLTQQQQHKMCVECNRYD